MGNSTSLACSEEYQNCIKNGRATWKGGWGGGPAQQGIATREKAKPMLRKTVASADWSQHKPEIAVHGKKLRTTRRGEGLTVQNYVYYNDDCSLIGDSIVNDTMYR